MVTRPDRIVPLAIDTDGNHPMNASPAPVRLLLVSGSTRAGSTNTAALRTARDVAPVAVTAVLWERLVDVPAFVPEDDREPPPVTDLRRELAAADAVVFCTPEYAGTLPGSFKNAIDWVVGTGELYRKPVAWISVGAAGRGAGAEAGLRVVLGYVDSEIVEPACRRIVVRRDAVTSGGLVLDPEIRARLAEPLDAVAAYVRDATAVRARSR